MTSPAYTIAHDSYERCLKAPDFFANLYENLLSSDPAVTALFANTQFPRQHRLLQHGLGLLLIYAKRGDDELLERVAARHSAAGIDVSPDKYPLFMEALLHAVSLCDPDFGTPVAEAWQEALHPGVEFMKSRYN